MKSKNPHNVCTWNEQSDCASCGIQGQLHCKWDKKILGGFYAIGFPPIIIAIFGMVVIGILTGVKRMAIFTEGRIALYVNIIYKIVNCMKYF